MISRTSPATRETAVAAAKIAVAHASRRRCPPSPAGAAAASPGVTFVPPPLEEDTSGGRSTRLCYDPRARAAGVFTYGEHQATEEARTDRGAGADGKSPFQIDGEDADEASGARSRGRRRHDCRAGASCARPPARSRRRPW